MNIKELLKLKDKAEKEIAKIIRDLESDTGLEIKSSIELGWTNSAEKPLIRHELEARITMFLE